MEITKQTAKQIYKNLPGWFQERLNDEFGEDTFKEIDFTTFKTFNDLCIACNITEKEFDEKWKNIPVDPDTVLYEKMKILSKAYNQDWIIDHYNNSQKKWFPIFQVSASGFGFSYSGYDYGYTYSAVGSRFAFENESKSDHAGKTFTKLFEQFITNKL